MAKPDARAQGRWQAGFTLVELMVVTAIIVLLSSLVAVHALGRLENV